MNLVRRVLARKRIKEARRLLAKQPSPRSYAVLAREYAVLGMTRDVRRVCEEGIGVFPGSSELTQLRDRAQRLEHEERLMELKHELKEAPRAALYDEMVEILVELGLHRRAEETVEEWMRGSNDEEARLAKAKVLVRRFYADRGRDVGQRALTAIDDAVRIMKNDPRPLRLRLELLGRVGAWKDAMHAAADLLQLEPGDPALEARYRVLSSQADVSVDIDRAFLRVENTGQFSDEEEPTQPRAGGANVRPILKQLADEEDVEAALYLRGATSLVQGPKGATADRTARSVRQILSSGRTAGRRLGLGRIVQVQLEGDFGTLAIAPGEMDAGAVWCTGHLNAAREQALVALAGLNAEVDEVES